MALERAAPRALVLLALVAEACVLPTPLGELTPSTTTTETTTDTAGTTDHGATGITSGLTSIGPPAETSDSGEVGPLPMHAWVMRYDDWLATLDEGTGGTDTSDVDSGNETEEGIPPDTLVVQISTAADSCEDPQVPLECGGQWSIFMLIPPELQAPGTYALFPQLSAIASLTGEVDGSSSCSGGGGTLEGTAELTVVSAQEVRGHLSMTVAFDEFDANVDFVALGCG